MRAPKGPRGHRAHCHCAAAPAPTTERQAAAMAHPPRLGRGSRTTGSGGTLAPNLPSGTSCTPPWRHTRPSHHCPAPPPTAHPARSTVAIPNPVSK
eukprot:5747820-Prorocentrum_lima.AAC.1